MSVDSISSQVPFVLTLASPAEVNTAGEVQLSADNIVGAGVTPGAVEAAQDTADEALAAASIVWVFGGVFSIDIGIVPPSLLIPAPVTGTLTGVMAVASDAPDAAITVTTSIGGTPVTNGAVVIGIGETTVKSATPTAANATTLGTTAVLVTPTSANTVTLQVTVMLGFTRS